MHRRTRLVLGEGITLLPHFPLQAPSEQEAVHQGLRCLGKEAEVGTAPAPATVYIKYEELNVTALLILSNCYRVEAIPKT